MILIFFINKIKLNNNKFYKFSIYKDGFGYTTCLKNYSSYFEYKIHIFTMKIYLKENLYKNYKIFIIITW